METSPCPKHPEEQRTRKAKADGTLLPWRCKPCERERSQRYRERHPEVREASRERAREQQRRYREENPEAAREAARERRRRWREANREADRAYSRRRYEENGDVIRERARLWREEHPEATREHARRWREANPEVSRRWREENPEVVREYARRWREANPEYARRWRDDNREVVREYASRRRARKAAAPVVEPGLTWETVAARDGMTCAYCGVECDPTDGRRITRRDGVLGWVCGPTYPTLDHVIPLRHEGAHASSNVVLACFSCNASKSDRLDFA